MNSDKRTDHVYRKTGALNNIREFTLAGSKGGKIESCGVSRGESWIHGEADYANQVPRPNRTFVSDAVESTTPS